MAEADAVDEDDEDDDGADHADDDDVKLCEFSVMMTMEMTTMMMMM